MICFCLKKKVKNITPLAPFYKETSIKYNTSSAQESLRGCTGTMHVIKFYTFFIIIIFFHLSFIFICNGKSWNITFNCFLTYKAIQTRPPVLLVASPYKSCIAPPSIKKFSWSFGEFYFVKSYQIMDLSTVWSAFV
jgi:hypothetical protein